MKLCWDTIDDIKLTTKGDLGEYWGVPNYRLLKQKIEYAEGCLNCGYDFMRREGSNSKFCDKECRHEKSLANIFETRVRAYVKSINLRQVRKSKLKGTLNKNILAGNKMPYNSTPASIKLCKDIREYPPNSNILQLKCENCVCGKWFNPNYFKVNFLSNCVSGNVTGNPMTYCSDECRKKCGADKDVPQIMADDLMRAGHYVEAVKIRVGHNKRKPTPLKVTFGLAKKYHHPPKKVFIRKNRIYLNVIKSKLNQDIIARANTKYWQRYQKLRYDPTRRNKKRDFGFDYKLDRNKYALLRHNVFKEEEPKKYVLKRLLYYSRARSKKKGFENNITYNWLLEQVKNKCPKTGFEFNFKPDVIRDQYAPSIDRIDNSKGYTTDNCQVVIWAYNCAKGPYTDELLYTILKTLI